MRHTTRRSLVIGFASAMAMGGTYALICLITASSALAKDGGFPNIDLQQRCQNSQRAMDTMLGTTSNTFDSCMKSEQATRELLFRDWATIPASVKAQCVVPMS